MKIVCGALVLGVATLATMSAVVTAQETGTQAAPGVRVRLVHPFTKVSDLSEEQRAQILTIRREIRTKIRALETEELERSLGVLTEAQKLQVQGVLDAEQAQRDARAEARRRDRLATQPATQPVR